MSKATVIRKDLGGGHHTTQWLVLLDGNHYIVSHSTRLAVPETLAFAADEKGKVTDWADLAGGKNLTHEQVIAQLEEHGERPYFFNNGENGGPCGALDDLIDLLDRGMFS